MSTKVKEAAGDKPAVSKEEKDPNAVPTTAPPKGQSWVRNWKTIANTTSYPEDRKTGHTKVKRRVDGTFSVLRQDGWKTQNARSAALVAADHAVAWKADQ